MASASLRGITVGYTDEGDGEPLVLIHGHPFDRTMWRPQVEHFASSGWRVIALDLRGYGRSTVVAGTTSLETFARDVVALIDRLRAGRIVVAGLSMGGQVAMELHRLFPERLAGLVLADTSPHAETDEGRRRRHEAADRLLREGMAASADDLLSKMLARRNVAALPAVAEHVREMMRGTDPRGAAAALRGRAARRDYVDGLRAVRVPALVVVGREDELTPVADAELMHALIPGSSLAVVERAGHLPNLERPAEFNAAVARFLSELPTAARPPAEAIPR